MRIYLLSLALVGLVVGTGCDTTVVTTEARSSARVDRSTDRVRFDLSAAIEHEAFLDIEDPDPNWFSDVPSSSLEVVIRTESRGVLGMNVVETTADAWIEGHRDALFDWWVVDGEPNARTLTIDQPLDACDAGVCFGEYTLVVVFSDPDARVKVDVDAKLRVDYDEFLAGEPVVALGISGRY